ncbi:MAG: hypothetical protein Fur003_0400 [Candidatus Dojkabacteria bacterium]
MTVPPTTQLNVKQANPEAYWLVGAKPPSDEVRVKTDTGLRYGTDGILEIDNTDNLENSVTFETWKNLIQQINTVDFDGLLSTVHIDFAFLNDYQIDNMNPPILDLKSDPFVRACLALSVDLSPSSTSSLLHGELDKGLLDRRIKQGAMLMLLLAGPQQKDLIASYISNVYGTLADREMFYEYQTSPVFPKEDEIRAVWISAAEALAIPLLPANIFTLYFSKDGNTRLLLESLMVFYKGILNVQGMIEEEGATDLTLKEWFIEKGGAFLPPSFIAALINPCDCEDEPKLKNLRRFLLKIIDKMVED